MIEKECFFCREKNPIVLEEHHIYPKWAQKISLTKGLPNETITVCRNCHKKLHHVLSYYRSIVETTTEEEGTFDKTTVEMMIEETETPPLALRQKLVIILDTLIKLETEHKNVPKSLLVKSLRKKGLKTKEITRLLKTLTKEGVIYSPKEGFLKKT